MGLFKNIFGSKKEIETTRFEMLSDGDSGFYSWNGKLYQSDLIRACIRPKARAIGKLGAKHIRGEGENLKINPDPFTRFLLEEPNKIMTMQVLLEKMTVQLELNNNAFAYIKRDLYGYPMEIYPIPCSMVEVVEGKAGDLYLKFYFNTGNKMTIPYDDVIHIRKDFNENDFFGESPAKALEPIMEIINTVDQGVVKAVKNSNIIKWLLKFKTVMRPEDIDKERQRFVDNYLSISSTSGGAAATDAKYDAEQVKSESYIPNSEQMQSVVQRLYSFFNTNEKIIQSKYTEDEWLSYYEAEIEPIAMQLSGEFTRKMFTRKERGFGNKIIFESSNLSFASMSTKLNLVQLVDRGALTPNEWRTVLNLGPIEGGDKPIRRLDTALIGEGNTIQEGGEEDGEKTPG